MYDLPVKIERFENQFAVMRNEISGEIKWPVDYLPKDAQPGDSAILTAVLQKKDSSEEEKYTKMRIMLEELIN